MDALNHDDHEDLAVKHAMITRPPRIMGVVPFVASSFVTFVSFVARPFVNFVCFVARSLVSLVPFLARSFVTFVSFVARSFVSFVSFVATPATASWLMTASHWTAALVFAVAVTPVAAQFLEKPTRPQVETPKGPVRQVIFKNCTSCHGIDDYAYNALDRAGWNALIDTKHKGLNVPISDADRSVLLDWVVTKFGPTSKPFPRAYVPPTITTFFSDTEAQALITRACSTCHGVDRVNDARYSPDRWRVIAVDMRERGSQLTDEELERLVEWLGRVKGTNPNQ